MTSHRATAVLSHRVLRRVPQLAAACVFLAFAGPAWAQNLVQNPGFEDTTNPNGGLTSTSSPGWSLASDQFTYFTQSNGEFVPNSGNWLIVFGDESIQTATAATLSQVIPTVPGQEYLVSFFLANLGSPTNQFNATFGDQPVLSLSNAAPFGYTQYSASVLATSTQTTLAFTGEQVPSYFELDDISVEQEGAPVPLLGTGVPSFITGFVGIVAVRMRRRSSQFS